IASYSGDSNFAPTNSAAVTVTVTKEDSATTIGFVTFGGDGTPSVSKAPAAAQYGSPYILQIAVAGKTSSGQCATQVVPCPTGTVILTDGGKPLNDFSGKNSAPLNSIGIAEDQPVQLGVGVHSLVATYGGDNSFNGSTSTGESV